MPNQFQLMKKYGLLQNVALADVSKATPAASIARLVGEEPLDQRFCLHPDFPDEEIAGSTPGEIELSLDVSPEEAEVIVGLHRAMWDAMQTGSGSWPKGCKAEYPDRHAFTYFVRPGWSSNWTRPVKDSELQELIDPKVWPFTLEQAMSMFGGKPMYEVAIKLMERSWYKRGVAAIRVDKESDANVVIINKPIAGSTIGYAYYNSKTCSNQVTCNIDSTYGPSLHGGANLLTHETGHNNNLQHEFSGQGSHHGIMSYSPQYPFKGFREGPPATSLPKDPSIAVLNRYYGDEPMAYPGDGGGTPPPPVGEYTPLTGELWADNGSPIRGTLVAGSGTDATTYFIEKVGAKYRPTRKVL